jgi:hypothetical protein
MLQEITISFILGFLFRHLGDQVLSRAFNSVMTNRRTLIIFDGAATFNNISISGNMLSTYNGAISVRLSSGARMGAGFTISCNMNYVGSNPAQTSTSC